LGKSTWTTFNRKARQMPDAMDIAESIRNMLIERWRANPKMLDTDKD
jgi:hypothetical protein